MWSNKNKEKEGKKVITTTQTRYVTETSQTVSVRTTTVENRNRSISMSGAPLGGSRDLIPSSSMSRIDKNFLPLPSNTIPKATSASNLGRTSVDARPLIGHNVNLNYQSPYRNSAVYSSFQNNSRPNTANVVSPIKLPPPPSTLTSNTNNTIFRRALPATIVPASQPTNKKIQVKKTGKFYDSSGPIPVAIPTYDTHSRIRGEILIINNIMFKDKGERHGAKVDHENLEALFKQMGFKVTTERDLKSSGMRSKVRNFSKKSSLKNVDIAIMVVMSHGTKNTTLGGTEVFGLDEQGVNVEELIEIFNETDCKYMANKPKIFIFQCCRGDNEQFVESDTQRIPAKKTALTDALIAYSTLPGYVSHRDPVSGTWYIRTLCDVFSQHAHEYHVEDLLKMVDVKLSRIASNIRQTTNYENRGFKRCYLHPV